jgi:hypothetical protein
MECGKESIRGYFPDETESDTGSYYGELRDYTGEGTKHSRHSFTSGCFGWVRRRICGKNNLDSDSHSYEKKFPDYTGQDKNTTETRLPTAAAGGSEEGYVRRTIWIVITILKRRKTQKMRERAQNTPETLPPAATSGGSEDGYVRRRHGTAQ